MGRAAVKTRKSLLICADFNKQQQQNGVRMVSHEHSSFQSGHRADRVIRLLIKNKVMTAVSGNELGDFNTV